MALIKGSAFLVGLDGDPLNCQLDANITLGQDMESEDACKPLLPNNDGSWRENTSGDRNWEVSGSGKVEDDDKDTLTTLDSLLKHFLGSNTSIEISVGTNDPKLAFARTFSGTGKLTSLTVNFPATGSATYDYTLEGLGKPSYVKTPKTP